MGDEYNVLGNFENLNSANILKNISLFQQSNENTPKFDVSGIDDVSDNSIELDVSPKKKTKDDKNSTKVKKDKAKRTNSTIDSTLSGSVSTVETEQVAPKPNSPTKQNNRPRTRSSIKNSANTTLETTSSSVSVKSKRKSPKKQNNLNKTTTENGPNNSLKDTNITKKSTRGRRKKATANSTVAETSTTVETIEIDGSDYDNQPSSSSMLAYLQTGRNEPRDVMRARRNFIAERAARCPTVDVVDLITSPMPRVEGFIDLELDSSNENKSPTSKFETVKPNASFDLSFEEDNPELSIKINWRFKPEIFKLRKHQKFLHIFEQLAKRENVEIDQILFDLNNQIIKPDDTPASIDYKIYQFIDGRAMSNSEFCGSKALHKKKRNPNLIKLKVQSDKFKKPLKMEMLKTDKFRTLIIKCAEELKLPYEHIKLSFDGESLQNEQTPVDVELEGGEVIEIHLKA